VGRAGLDLQLLDHARQSRRLTGRQVEDQPRQGRGVDNRVLERRREAAAHQVGVEGVVAVLDEDGAAGEAEEGSPSLPEAGSADQHRAVDLVPGLRVAIDRRARFDQRVEQRQRLVEPEALRANLDHQERGVAGGLDVEGDVLSLFQPGLGRDRGELPGQLLEDHLEPLAGLEPDA
jgi:hypothetical protein